MKVKDLTIVVTGGAGDLGKEVVSNLTQKGANVFVLDLKESEHPNYFQVDLLNEDSVSSAVEQIIEQTSKIDVLVNSAGSIHSQPLINIMNPKEMRHSYEDFKKYVSLNLDTTFITTSVVVEKMVKKRTKGLIINISSISATGNAGQSAYSAAKAGVEALTKTWSKELGVFGIRSVAIAPGFIETESTHHALNQGIINHVKKNTPLRKLGEASNISHSIVYAIENDFLNGVVLSVNGGLTI